MKYQDFVNKLCNISKVIDFIYKISKLYSEIFDNNNNELLYEFFKNFFSQKIRRKIN